MDTCVPTLVSLGWLWFDDDPKTGLEQKVGQASEQYRHKFGSLPRICYVSQKELGEQPARLGALQLRGARNVLPGHFLFVVEEQAA